MKVRFSILTRTKNKPQEFTKSKLLTYPKWPISLFQSSMDRSKKFVAHDWFHCFVLVGMNYGALWSSGMLEQCKPSILTCCHYKVHTFNYSLLGQKLFYFMIQEHEHFHILNKRNFWVLSVCCFFHQMLKIGERKGSQFGACGRPWAWNFFFLVFFGRNLFHVVGSANFCREANFPLKISSIIEEEVPNSG